MVSDAMALYSLTSQNKKKLKGCNFKETLENEQIRGRIFIFNDPYRKLNIDIVFTEYGELYISDFYGESMERESIFYVKL